MSDEEERSTLVRIFVDGSENYGAYLHGPGTIPLVGDEVWISQSLEDGGTRDIICIVEKRRHYWPCEGDDLMHESWEEGRRLPGIDEFSSCICLYLKTISDVSSMSGT